MNVAPVNEAEAKVVAKAEAGVVRDVGVKAA